MNESIFFITIIGIAVSLIVTYYIIKYAIVEALGDVNSRNNNAKLDHKLDDIFIQLGGNPIAFREAEQEIEIQFLEECEALKKSKLSQSKLRKETERLKNESEIKLIKRKMKISRANL